MPPSSSRTHFRQRPYRKRRPRAVGSDLKGCVLWLLPVHPSDLVHSSCEGASKTSRGFAKKRERGEDPTILLMMGRDDHLLSAYLDLSAESSAVDTPSWRSGAASGTAIPAVRRGLGWLSFGDLMPDARARLAHECRR